MQTEYTAVIKQEDDWWIGWIAEILGVNCQEPTHQELLETLRITLTEAWVQTQKVALFGFGDNSLPNAYRN